MNALKINLNSRQVKGLTAGKAGTRDWGKNKERQLGTRGNEGFHLKRDENPAYQAGFSVKL
jgi:hypothetical protein